MKSIAQKVVSWFVLIAFCAVAYLEFVKPALRSESQQAFSGLHTLDQSRQIFRELGGAPADKPLVVFVTAWCPVCRSLEQSLQQLGLRYVRADIERDERALFYYQLLTKNRGTGVPLTLAGTTIVLGYDLQAIVQGLRETSGSSAQGTSDELV